jgi:hypothetical protein
LKSQKDFSIKEKSYIYIYIYQMSQKHWNRLFKDSFFHLYNYSQFFSKKTKLLILNILKYKWVVKMVFSIRVHIKYIYTHFSKSYINNLAFLNNFYHWIRCSEKAIPIYFFRGAINLKKKIIYLFSLNFTSPFLHSM